MEENSSIKFETESSMVVRMAQYIKQSKRKFKGVGNIDIKFYLNIEGGSASISFGDNTYHVQGGYSDVYNMVNRALGMCETGVIIDSPTCISVVLFSKPTNSFCLLARSLAKKAGLHIRWEDLRSESVQDNQTLTRYLCHNDEICKEALSFIRGKASRDVLKASIYQRNDSEGIYHVLSIEIATPTGKTKAIKEFYVSTTSP